MAVFQVDIQTKAGSIYISNIYHVDAADIAGALVMGLKIADCQKVTIPSFWTIDAVRVSTPATGDGFYITQQVSIAGTRGTPGQLLPYFNRFRVLMSVGYQRPLVKYLIGVGEQDADGDTFTQAVISEFNGVGGFCNLIRTTPGLVVCSPTGLPILTASLAAAVGMRQLRRASKRKAPVI